MRETLAAIVIFGFPFVCLYLVVRITRFAWKGK